MNRDEFLSQLKSALRYLPDDERQDIIRDYEEYFSLGIAEGKTEEEISQKLGSPKQIAKELIAIHRVDEVQEKASPKNIIKAVWAVIGLGFFNLFIVLWPFLGFVFIVFFGWFNSAIMASSPLVFLFDIILFPRGFDWFELFASFALSGMGIFLGIGMYYLTRLLVRGFIKYLNFNIRLVKGAAKK